MVCKKCNNVVGENDNFCSVCGERIYIEENSIEVQTDNEIDNQNSETENFSKYQFSSYYQKYKKESDVNSLFLVSIVFAVMSFFIGAVFSELFFTSSLCFIIVATFMYIKNKNRKNGWTIAFFALTFFINGSVLFYNLTIGKFAKNVTNRIYDYTGIELVEKTPKYYEISFMNDELTYYILEDKDYVFNNIVYQYFDDHKESIENLITSNSNFSDTYLNQITNEFKDVIIEGVDVILVYNIKTNTYSYPDSLANSEIIIINYDYEEGVLQILEVKGMK